jgi:hypothetical protein
MKEGNVSTIPLVPVFQQQAHKENLTQIQVDEAKKMGISNLTTKNTQYDLLRLVKFQKARKRTTDKLTRHIVKANGRKRARLLIAKRRDVQPIIEDNDI